jgi:hypothetical protein
MNADMDGHRLLHAMKPECIVVSVTNKPAARVELLGDSLRLISHSRRLP